MDTINTRIADLIQKSEKTKTEWAKRLNVTPQFVSSLCNGKKTPSDRTIVDICRVSGVREEWLHTGKEPKYPEKEPDPWDKLLSDRGILQGDLSAVKSVITAFLELDKPSRDAVISFVQNCATKLTAPVAKPTTSNADLAKKISALEQKNKELTERLEAVEKEDANQESVETVVQNVTLPQFR